MPQKYKKRRCGDVAPGPKKSESSARKAISKSSLHLSLVPVVIFQETYNSLDGKWNLNACTADLCSCKKWSNTDNSLICASCNHGVAEHVLEIDAKAKHDGVQCMLGRFFSLLRNVRAAGSVEYSEKDSREWGSGWCCNRVFNWLEQMDRQVSSLQNVLHDIHATLSCIRQAQTLARHQSRGNDRWGRRISLAAELDTIYWHLRYAALTSFPSTLQCCNHVDMHNVNQIVPPPEVYFTCLIQRIPSKNEIFGGLNGQGGQIEKALLDDLCDTFEFSFSEDGEVLFPIKSNPLLAILQATWLELEVCAKYKDWGVNLPLTSSNYEGTMRGSDPFLPELIRTRCDSIRDWTARLMSFSVPNKNALKLIADTCAAVGADDRPAQILEVGAGLGYWKYCMGIKFPRIEYIGLDKDPPPDLSQVHGKRDSSGVKKYVKRDNEYHGRSPGWGGILKGETELIHSLSAGNEPTVLFMSYPPPSGSMGIDALKAYRGNTFIYAGEIRGDTGTVAFEKELCSNWSMSSSIHLPNFANTAAVLMIFQRKYYDQSLRVSNKNVFVESDMLLTCNHCGCKDGGVLRRCRRTRIVSYCSEPCRKADETRLLSLQILRHIRADTGERLGIKPFNDKKQFARISKK